MDLLCGDVLPGFGEYERLNKAGKFNLKLFSDRIFSHPPKDAVKIHPTFLALRHHMLVSLFCGEYPLEMRAGRRPKDA